MLAVARAAALAQPGLLVPVALASPGLLVPAAQTQHGLLMPALTQPVLVAAALTQPVLVMAIAQAQVVLLVAGVGAALSLLRPIAAVVVQEQTVLPAVAMGLPLACSWKMDCRQPFLAPRCQIGPYMGHKVIRLTHHMHQTGYGMPHSFAPHPYIGDPNPV